MNETHILITLAGIHWIALMSPGPDFALIVQNTTKYGRTSGQAIALGLSVGILSHSILSLLGLSLLLHQHHLLFTLIGLAGGLYLAWTGIHILKQVVTSSSQTLEIDLAHSEAVKKSQSSRQAFLNGYMTNILNPKALVFFISLMSGLIPADFSVTGKCLAVFILWSLAFLWFSLLAWAISTRKIQEKLMLTSRYIDTLCGIVLSTAGGFILFQTVFVDLW